MLHRTGKLIRDAHQPNKRTNLPWSFGPPMLATNKTSRTVHSERVTSSELCVRVLNSLHARFDSHHAIETLRRATAGEIYVFGGAVRRAMFGDGLAGDLDIMVPNGDDRAFAALDSMGVRYELNSQKLRRYRWNSLQIDLFQPREFFSGFLDVEAALRYFDLKVNALALHFRAKRILDPFNVLPDTPVVDPGINWPRWNEMSSSQIVVLALRLAKIMYELPDLEISMLDAQLLFTNVVPKIRECNWADVHYRYPLGKDRFINEFTETVLHRARMAPHHNSI
jgi:hypothetical protein